MAPEPALIAAVQANCHVTDARHARSMTLCTYLLEMREMYRWEHGIAFGVPLARADVGAWLAAREALWEREFEDAPGYSPLPLKGRVFISVNDRDKSKVTDLGRKFVELGFSLIATGGTATVLEKAGLKVDRLLKISEGRPNAIDLMKNKEIQLVINTPAGQSPRADEVKIRTTAVYTGTPIMTTLSGAEAAALGIGALQKSGYGVTTVQEYH